MTDDTNDRVVLTENDDAEAVGDRRPKDGSAASRLVVTDDQDARMFEGTVDGVAAAGVVYTRAGRRLTLLATSVFPQFRRQGIASALLFGVLDSIRDRGDTVTVTCPFAARLIASHPEYADVIDPNLPGVPRHQH